VGELKPQQRAAKITCHLYTRALMHLPGMTTQQDAMFLELRTHSAKALLNNISGPGVPIYNDGDTWFMDVTRLKVR